MPMFARAVQSVDQQYPHLALLDSTFSARTNFKIIANMQVTTYASKSDSVLNKKVKCDPYLNKIVKE